MNSCAECLAILKQLNADQRFEELAAWEATDGERWLARCTDDPEAKAAILVEMAFALMNVGHNERAVQRGRESHQIVLARVSPDSPEAALSWYKLAVMERWAGQNLQAVDAFQNAMRVAAQLDFDAARDMVVDCHEALVPILIDTMSPEAGLEHLKWLMETVPRASAERVAGWHRFAGDALVQLGTLDSARVEYQRVLDFDLPGRTFNELATPLNARLGLARLAMLAGDPEEEARLLALADAAIEPHVDEQPVLVFNVLTSVADCALRQRRYQDAKQSLERAGSLREKVSGLPQTAIARWLLLQGRLASVDSRPIEAQGFFHAALNALTATRDTTNPLIGYALLDLGSIENDWGDYQQAEDHTRAAIEVLDRCGVTACRDRVIANVQFARLLTIARRDQEAAETLKRAADEADRCPSMDDLTRLGVAMVRATFHEWRTELPEATRILDAVASIGQGLDDRKMDSGAEYRQHRILLQALGGEVAAARKEYESLLATEKPSTSLYGGSGINLRVNAGRVAVAQGDLERAMALVEEAADIASRRTREIVRSQGEREALAFANSWVSSVRDLACTVALAGDDPALTLRAWAVVGSMRDLASAASAHSDTDRLSARSLSVMLEKAARAGQSVVAFVRARLPRELAEEGVRKPTFRVDPRLESQRYLAFVAGNGPADCRVVELESSETLDARILELRRRMEASAKARGQAEEAPALEAAREVEQALVAPLRAYLPHPHWVVIPDVGVWLVNFYALVFPDGTYLLDSSIVVDTIELEDELQPSPPVNGVGNGGAVIVGAPDYGVVTQGAKRPRGAPAFPAESESSEEAKTVEALVRNNLKVTETTVLLGPNATKERVAASMPGARIVHLATHGFFLGDRMMSWFGRSLPSAPWLPVADLAAADPMELTGIALSGANQSFEGGVLTARELSKLPLQGTQLVVLSACEAGAGLPISGQGLFGFCRALHEAGVRRQVNALNTISRRAALRWMTSFYGAYAGGGTLGEILKRTHLNYRTERGSETVNSGSWASFVGGGW